MRAVAALAGLAALLWAGIAVANPERWKREWPDTNFSKTSVESWSEIRSGGPPKDGIPALTDPGMIPAAQEGDLEPREMVITVDLDGAKARAYPVRYLMWHEIANDEIAGLPVAVTYCPLCNSGIVFDRRVDGKVLEFGVSGKLRNSDMIMYDRQTESWWQQTVGRGIVGRYTGTELRQLPVWMESWQSFREAHPDGLVMAEPTGHSRPYGANPYQRYDSSERPFLYSGEMPPQGISPMERVVRVGERAWPMTRLRNAGTITEAGVTISWESGAASPLDAGSVGGGREIGQVRVKNAEGEDIVHDVIFAFVFQAFWPEGEWMTGTS